ncbi:MAG: tRNA (guanosine(37)-N1)-methyltransferase TrmD [Gammaproteobacteria bacterium]|nr:tRNA (guanosine(37)-N1)-methyltransferase TrmD [Gammaproteobacteria bacterium]
MDIHIISIFPEMFDAITKHGVIARAVKQGVVSLRLYNPRDFASDRHSTVDDRPYGGGPGMVMMPDVMAAVLKSALGNAKNDPHVVYLTPQGRRFDYDSAIKFAESSSSQSLVMIAGRYEGIDERFIEHYVDSEWSVGDFVLSGGELPAMIMVDAITRLLPDSLGNSQSAEQDSFVDGILDCPHYTRPEQFEGESVPAVLLSGDHRAIERWRVKQALGRTWQRRPDLLNAKQLNAEQLQLLEEFKSETGEQ